MLSSRDTVEHAVVSNHLDGLTGIRGIAALWVLLLHGAMLHVMAPAVGDGRGALWLFASKGWLGVDMFFVLSGFIISFVYQRKLMRPSFGELRHFWLMRLARIYPLHLATMVAMAAMVLGARIVGVELGHASFYTPGKAAASLFLVHGWMPGLKGFNYVSWSVSSEWFAYLLFPLLVFPVVRLRARWANLLVIASILLAMAALHGGTKAAIENQLHPLLRVGGEFVAGCLLFNVFRISQRRRLYDVLAPLTLVAMAILCALPRPAVSDFVVVALAGLLIFSLALAPRGGGRLFSGRSAVYLGKTSYSLYLVHGVVFPLLNGLTRRLFPKPSLALGLVLFVVLVAMTLLVSHYAWKYVEELGRQRLRTWAERRRELAAQRRRERQRYAGPAG